MLSSLDALASKISPGSGSKSPSQQQQQFTQQHQQQLSQKTYYQQECIDNQNHHQHQQSSHTLRLNGNHYNGGLDSNGNKLCHITHNTIHHPYHKQPNSPNGSGTNTKALLLQQQQQQQQQKLATYTASSTPPTTPLSPSSLSPQECLQQQQQQQQQHELFQQQLQRQQNLQHLQQQQHQSISAPLSPTTTSSQPYDENDSQHEFSSCLKENQPLFSLHNYELTFCKLKLPQDT